MEVLINEDLYLLDMFLARISHHSKKMGGVMSEKIISYKELLSKAKDIADKLCNQKTVEQADITSLLVSLRELRSWLTDNKTADNQHQQVIMKSVDSIIASFE